MSALSPIACGGADEDRASLEAVKEVSEPLVSVPAKGTPSTLDIGEWNLEWFGSKSNGPTNESLQLSNVHDVILGADLDVWGLEEVVSVSQFNQLVSQLPGYAGLVASDPSVTSGSTYYSSSEQKVAILYKTSIATVNSAKLILTDHDSDFAGRPPLEVSMTVNVNGTTANLAFIVLHAKAFNDTASYDRRLNASIALKSYLDAAHVTDKVIVVGDFNDDVDTSITAGEPSPYKNLVDDAADYLFPTKALSDTGQASTVSYSDMIDHHLITNEVVPLYLAGSAEVYHVDQYIANYGTTTTDHYPTLARYTLGGAQGTIQVSAPNGGESFLGSSVHPITWTSSQVSSVRLDYTSDGMNWTNITSGVQGSLGTFIWTVPNVATSLARVKASDAFNAMVTDTSDGTFTITAGSGAKVFLNEILANEPGSDTGGEFIELVNTGGGAADLSGWTLADTTGVRHTFPQGASLPAGAAVTVFASASAIPAGTPNATAASTGGLGLNNSGDTVTLKDNLANMVDSFAYPSSLSSTDGVSMNRNPDGNSSGTFVLHTTLAAASSSPGTRADGSAFP